MSTRKIQISEAQNRFRGKKKDCGFFRLQTWLSIENQNNLTMLAEKLDLSREEIVNKALSALSQQHV
ncbi:hypothetical protein [Hydromonas duriensis]|uniref:Ribbon-helix-helix CopG family protein n=1 Tax=Hydromonas duriensis TaxID=1527608 RepID=A0A4R6Y9J7_9BURK|nr:hypothetical protein [Hydromonas duriensis]TDR32156.1 hypothetical protein DFR44_10539 [Hydromonas duriensis]